jgi:Mg-chelatase subunit ChlD/truncated hemoglobin YjbI
MQISIKDIKAGRTWEFQVEPSDTSAELKEKISETQHVPAAQQRLIYRGKTLADGQTLAQAGVEKGATMHLVLRLQSSFAIDIRTMTGKTVTFEVQGSAYAKAVRQIVEELLGLHADQHVLVLGKRLPDDAILSDHGVKQSSILHLVRLPLQVASAQVAAVTRSSSPCACSEEADRVRVYGELGTLYARCGGIFGIAGFVDRCMDKWMVDATLNANAAVASWHERAQRCGFKFLVTQLMGSVAGGPQMYTGRSMADAHKHLNIQGEEWRSFMAVFYEVCREFGLPNVDVDDLASILNSMESDCVVQPGEEILQRPAGAGPQGESLYARVGGVYPLALFADRLVDALLCDKRVNIPVDGQKRNEASLKYLFTEVVCCAAGGPEIVTATSFAETRLLLPAKKMFFLLDAAKAASDHLDSFSLRADLIKRLSEVQNLIIDPARSPAVPAHLEQRRAMVEKLGKRVGMTILYVPRGGVVMLDFGASAELIAKGKSGLAQLGFTSVEKSNVKSAEAAASGSMLSSAVIAARYAAVGSFVAARKRVHGDPRTLYGRGGGVFGLAKLVDRLMDVWMADTVLNKNDMVARWHQSQQKYGFKFLVTQIFGYLTGGPQRYTGQPMDVAHKHLNIRPSQWDAFMEGVDRVFREFKLDRVTQQELSAIIASFKDQVVVHDGESVPVDPALCRRPPNGTSLYAQAGGVYPLAHFAALLVEKTLDRHSRVHIPFDPSFKRSTPGLKYLVTELVCSSAGGAEVVTSRGFDDAKLGVPAEDWPAFLELVAGVAGEVWPSSTLIQRSVKAAIEDQQAELCIGMAPEAQDATVANRRTLMQAGFGLFEASAALERFCGDCTRAMTMLVSGWAPPAAQAAPKPPSQPAVCPFSGASTGAAGVCPFSGAGASSNVASSSSAGPASSQQVGRVLGDPLQQQLDDLLVEDVDLVCPITLTLFHDPVMASDGCVYERVAVEELARVQGRSPVTLMALTGQVFPALEHKSRSAAFMKGRCEDLISFIARAQKQGQTLMALTAADRLKDYVVALTPQSEPELARQCRNFCQALGGAMPKLSLPQDRVSSIIKEQVARAKTEGENLLQERSAGGAEKSITFCIDTSGSMKGSRMDKAKENLLRIFDQYMEDEDFMSLVTFTQNVTTHFELQEVHAGGRTRMRSMCEDACRAGGGTAFWDALASCVSNLRASPPGSQQWIVALTDGADQHSRAHTLQSVMRAIQAAEGKPNLIVVGVQLFDQAKPDMEKLCTVTSRSVFIDASGDLSSLDDAFQQVAEMMCE